jgi:hypothetical protein
MRRLAVKASHPEPSSHRFELFLGRVRAEAAHLHEHLLVA